MTQRIAFYYLAVFLSAGVYNTIFPVWLHRQGLSLTEVSLILSVPIALKLAVDPVLGAIADRSRRRKGLLLALIGATAIGYASYLATSAFWQVALVALFCGAAWSAVLPIGDSIVARTLRREKLPYGRARSVGSASVLATSLLSGFLASAMADAAIFLLVASFSVALVVVWLALPSEASGPPAAPAGGTSASHDVPEVVPDRPTASFAILLAAGLILGAHSLLYAVGTLHWTALGFSPRTIGLFWAAALCAEILVFLASDGRRLGRVAPATLIVCGAVAGLLRWAGLAVAEEAWAIVLLQALQGATLAGVNVALMRYVATKMAPSRSGRAFGRVAAVSHGLIPLVVTMAAGPLLAAAGSLVFLMSAGLCALALALACAGAVLADRAAPAAVDRMPAV